MKPMVPGSQDAIARLSTGWRCYISDLVTLLSLFLSNSFHSNERNYMQCGPGTLFVNITNVKHSQILSTRPANKLFLKNKCFRMEMKEGTSAEAHIKRIKEITDNLAPIGVPISEEDQVVTLLGSL